MKDNRKIGREKEDLAAEYLEKKGYFIIEKNYSVRQAELDIVARQNDTLVFAEVKYRKNDKTGHPLEAVNYNKQKKISKAALFYMQQNKISIYNTSIRFDVIGILDDNITHIENAFDIVM